VGTGTITARGVRVVRLLTDDEIVRFLRQLRYDPQYHQPGRRLPLQSLLNLVGVPRKTADLIMLKCTPVSERIRAKISQAADLVARGIKFTHKGGVYVAELPGSPYALVATPEIGDGDPHMGVSQQALPEPVRPRRRLPAVPKVRWNSGEVVTTSVRHFIDGDPAGGSDLEVARRRFFVDEFPKSPHWRKQLVAARAARRRAQFRLMDRAGNARVDRKTPRRRGRPRLDFLRDDGGDG
jgi:hypothetical protein